MARNESVATLSPLNTQRSAFAPISDKSVDAWLSLRFADHDGVTRLMERAHYGQLLVQKPLYLREEDRKVCHVIVVHPPAGVCGGDELRLSSHVGAAGNVQITSPGASKWYKGNGHITRQEVNLDVETGATLEWLPQEAIFFDDAHVQLTNNVNLAKDSNFISSEILCFGRTRSGESFNSGQISQRTQIRCENKLIWFEQLQLTGGSPDMESSLLLSGKTVCATLIAIGSPVPAELIDSMRQGADEIANGVGHLGVTQLKSIVVARYLGDSSEIARRIMLHVWGVLRPAMLGRQAIVPRMWNT